MDESIAENAFAVDSILAMPELMDLPIVESELKDDEQLDNSIDLIQPEPILTAAGTMTITSTTEAPIAIDINDCNEVSPVQLIPSLEPVLPIQLMDLELPMDISPTEFPATPLSGGSMIDKAVDIASPSTPSVPKERKRRIIIDDDDESPTFNPLRSNKKIRGKNRRNRQNMLLKKQRKVQLLSPTDKTNENAVFTSPEAIVSVLLHFFFVFVSCLFLSLMHTFAFDSLIEKKNPRIMSETLMFVCVIASKSCTFVLIAPFCIQKLL